MRLIDLTGQRFGRLTVTERAADYVSPKGHHKVQWRCQCDCGNEVIVRGSSMRGNITQSCGCLHNELCAERKTVHGLCYTRLNRIWQSMKSRCYNSKQKRYAKYGGKGITICEEWLHNFQAFYDWAMANGYRDDLSIDRIDGDKGYYPENCRWASNKEQTRNRSITRRITINGETRPLMEWCEQLGKKYKIILKRLSRGWTPEEALELIPRGNGKTE